MYGFIRPASHYLSKEANQAYSRMYCGQCVALHDHFGYLSRTVTSYDATFFGLLLSAQQKNSESQDRRRCAVFPIKKEIVSPDEPATRFAAALAITLSAIKRKDKQQEKYSSVRGLVEKTLHSSTVKANNILADYGVPATLIETTLHAQQTVEQKSTTEILDYAKPTERFLSELLRTTAIMTDKPENSEILAQIGTHLGRIIYLIDSCVDLLDDIAKREFNALLAAYADEEGELTRPTDDQLTDLLMESLKAIKDLLPKLELHHHQELISNILLVGLPLTIQKQLSTSMKQLSKHRPALLKYAPHAALATALCVAMPSVAEASIYGDHVMCGEIDKDNKVFAFGCTFLNASASTSGLLDGCCNPCFYGLSTKIGCGSMCCSIAMQTPKAVLGIFSIKKFIIPKLKNHKQNHRNKQVREQVKLKKNTFAKLTATNNTSSKKIKDNPEWIILDSAIKDLFEKKLEKIFTNSHTSSSHRTLKTKCDDLLKELNLLIQNIQHTLESVKKTREDIDAVLKNQIGNLKSEERLKLTLFKALIAPTEIAPLIKDRRFDELDNIIKLVRSRVSTMSVQNN